MLAPECAGAIFKSTMAMSKFSHLSWHPVNSLVYGCQFLLQSTGRCGISTMYMNP